MSGKHDDQLRDLILAHFDERLADEEFVELQARLESDPDARREYVSLARLDAGLRDDGLGEMPAGDVIAFPIGTTAGKAPWWKVALAAAAVVAALAFLGRIFLLPNFASSDGGSFAAGDPAGQKALGVAVITAEAGAVWAQDEGRLQERGALEPGLLVLREGLAQIDFFGGASISLSGPAEIELISQDKAVLHRGRLRADVPPAARGFEIRAGRTRLEDLGTSFGLTANDDGEAEIVVFDGEVRATGNDGKPLSLFGGDAAHLENGEAIPRATAEGAENFPDIEDILTQAGNREASRYAAWREASLDLRKDPRLVAYYDFENLTPSSRRLRNRAASGFGSELDGGIVGARVANGRWERKTALDFRRQGDRVRFQIPGEFEALTVFAWVRIDALDRHLNSLFLTDYYDPREFHWQLSNRGALHFASSPVGVENLKGENRRFYSEVFWTPEKSGQWFQLATTVDRQDGGGVTHFVNGEAVGFSGGTNRGKPLPVMRIGEADLGNWSDPIWPDVAIRTLNGRIDEFAIFNEPLAAEEIRTLYEIGRP